ncbi:MAG: iron transporter [Trebonia sp.]
MSVLDQARHRGRRAASVAAIGLTALLAAACGSAGGTAATAAKQSTAPSATASPGGSGDMSGMSGMDMGSSPAASSAGSSAAGVKPVPTQILGTAVWQGMKITAEAMTPVPFLTYNGTSMREVKPAKNTSFHLMVMLNDAQTGVVIPYASVWGTITQGAKMPFDESLWPMISRYMGPHYGNDVSLPGAGAYKLTLLVSPPVSARHLEYQGVWLKPHKVSLTFHWQPPS